MSAFAVLLTLVASACASRPPATGASDPAWLQAPVLRQYVLEIGDVVDVKLFYHPELNENGLTVRPDGYISAQLVGDVPARGQTPSELARALESRYTQEGLLDPKVSIIVRKSAGLRVFVGGEVGNPGMIPHEGVLTLSRAILQAGGPKSTAETRTVVLLRESGRDEPLFAVVDLDRVLSGGRDFLLQPYDVVFVPRSTIARLNQFVEQYFVKLIPVSLNAGFSYTLGTVRTPP